MSIMFNEICINEEMLPKYTYIYIYIYMYVCVCVCVLMKKDDVWWRTQKITIMQFSHKLDWIYFKIYQEVRLKFTASKLLQRYLFF